MQWRSEPVERAFISTIAKEGDTSPALALHHPICYRCLMAWGLTNIILIAFIIMFAFPKETLEIIKRVRTWIHDDFQKHCTPEEWELIKHEWDDLD